MFGFLLVAQAFGIINQYFCKEALEEDFWDVPVEVYQSLEEEEKKQGLFMLNPAKLKEEYKNTNEALIVTARKKGSLLKAFEMIYEYSKELPDNASFKERLLLTKGNLPPEFFPSKTNSEECRIIPFKKDRDTINGR